MTTPQVFVVTSPDAGEPVGTLGIIVQKSGSFSYVNTEGEHTWANTIMFPEEIELLGEL